MKNRIERARGLGRRDFLKNSAQLAGVAAASTAFPSIFTRAFAADGDPVVTTAAGKLRGRIVDGVQAFKGIPYGAPTGGKMRFMPPAKPQPWSGVRDAGELAQYSPQLALGPSDPRLAGFYAVLVNKEAAGPSEDCLHLNVWTPEASTARKRSVLVWCHGGGFLIRSGGSPLYDGAALSKLGDVVVVTVNHRLNVFGFLNLQEFGDQQFASSGNVGMLDLVAALQWVRDNIANFGGDPNSVTIFGQSGGAGKVSTLLAMPSAKGLFHRAIMQSGASPRMATRAESKEVTELVFKNAGLKTTQVAELQALPADKLTEAAVGALKIFLQGKSLIGNQGFLPVVDGTVLPNHPFDPVATPYSATVPVMLGYTSTEMTLYSKPASEITAATLQTDAQGQFGANADQIIAVFRKNYPQATPAELHILIFTHGFTGVNSFRVAEQKVAQGKAPAYMYLFEWETPVLGLRAPHTIELPFVFNHLDMAQNMVGPVSPAMRELGTQVTGAWLSFAKTGNPNHAGLANWPAYDLQNRATMFFNLKPVVKNDPWHEERLVMMAK